MTSKKKSGVPDNMLDALIDGGDAPPMQIKSEAAAEYMPARMETDETRLAKLENIIKTNLAAFYAVGCALREIRDKRLYKLKGFSEFDDYCRNTWDMQRAHALRLETAADVIDNLKNVSKLDTFLPQTESQVRPLAKLTPEKQIEAWQKAVENAPKFNDKPKITARIVAQAADEAAGKQEKDKKEEEKKGRRISAFVSEAVADRFEIAYIKARGEASAKGETLTRDGFVEVVIMNYECD